MLYGEQKARQMARSVLPSTGRAGARHDLAAVKRRNRRGVRRELSLISSDPEWYWEAPKADLTDYPDRDINEVVWDRRAKDNVAAFIRWATESTRGIEDPEDRFNAVKGVLPDGLIGRHALYCHLAYQPEFRVEGPHLWSWRSSRWRSVEPSHMTVKQVDIEGMLRGAIEMGRHSDVNRRLREMKVGHHTRRRWCGTAKTIVDAEVYRCDGCNMRPFLGLHDVKDFAVHAMRWRSTHPEFVKAVMAATGR